MNIFSIFPHINYTNNTHTQKKTYKLDERKKHRQITYL